MAIIDAFKFDDNINNELKKVVHYGKEDEDIESVIASESIRGINKIAIVMPQSTLKESVIDVFKSIKGLNKKMVLSTTDVVDDYLATGEKFDLIIVDEAHISTCC